MSRQSTLNVSLTPKLEGFVRAKVRSGRYESASEVVRESLRAMQQRDRGERAAWAEIRKKVSAARDDVVAGRLVDGETAMADVLAELGSAASTRQKRPASRRTLPKRHADKAK